jgi:protocatechuate 3,4-dioxygenase alpha subunit
MSLQATTWQTVGPYFRIGLERLYEANIAGDASGDLITIEGRVCDGLGEPIPDAILEIWQANRHGKYAHPEDTQAKPLEAGFRGYGRVPTDDLGRFRFTTIKPGPVPGIKREQQAPHLVVGLMMRGLLKRLVTRIYFPNEPLNEQDEILRLVAPERRRTLLLQPVAETPGLFTWEIHMQGDAETVFFEI